MLLLSGDLRWTGVDAIGHGELFLPNNYFLE